MYTSKKKKDFAPRRPVTPQSRRAKELQDQLRFTRRAALAVLMMGGAVVGLLSRSYYLQIFRNNYYRTRSENNRVKVQVVPPVRGNIFDRNGIALSENVLTYDLIVNRSKSSNYDVLVEEIGSYLRFDDDDLVKYQADKRKKLYNQNVVVRQDLSEEEINRFLVDLHFFPGFDVVPSYKRYYPYGDLTAHVVGYINNINKKDLTEVDAKEYSATTKIGRTGIERQYENILHGHAGFRQAEVSKTGKVVRILKQTEPIPGDDLYLSLDLDLQKIIRDELEKESYDGAGVAIDPNNGEVLAIFSNPSFDANLFVNGISHKEYKSLRSSPRKNLFNRALNGRYSPASTIKPMMALAALHNYVVTPQLEIDCLGSYRIPEFKNTKKFYCWKRNGHGSMTAHSSIVQSCDVYFYSVGKELGIQRMYDYLAQFGLGEKTGIDLPSESTGILPNKDWKYKKYKKKWFIGDTINASIGQGFMSTTPLQMAYFTSILASRGQRYRPHLVTKLKNPVSGDFKLLQPKAESVPQNNPNAWNVVNESMIDVITSKQGTARKIRVNLPFKIAGKTGTAQVVSLHKGQRKNKKDILKKHRDNSVFIVYAPADNPVISMALILENAGGGSEIAAPIAIRILQRYFSKKTGMTS